MMSYGELLEQLGIREEEIAGRFGGMLHIHERFLLKFPEDSAYGRMEDGIRSGQLSEMEMGVHTLKGVSANLGLERLWELCAEGVRHIREQKEPMPEELHKKITEEYERTVQAIVRFRSEQNGEGK